MTPPAPTAERALDDRPILFVGDIQGCPRELARLVDRAGFKAGAHRLIPLGDTVNRGPDSPAVLKLLDELGAEPIQGNHERGLLKLAETGHAPHWATRADSAFVQLRALGRWEEAAARFAGWPLWQTGPGWIAVHAGLHPRLGPEETDPEFLTGVRFCDGQGRLPPVVPKGVLEAPPGYAHWYEHYRGERTVIFGHWAQLGLVRAERLWGLDTGCVYGRELSALWWPEQRLVQVPARRVYHPVS